MVRVALMLVAFQVSGFSEAARELGWFGDDTDCCDTCPNDAEGQRCPPDCPKCQCSHLRVTTLPPPRGDFLVEVLRDFGNEVAQPFEATQAPGALYLSPIFRPPRA